MGWKVWGERLDTADLTGTRVYQPVIPNKDIILIGARAWIICYNDPTFTHLNMRIFSDNGGVPGKLIATSTNNVTKASMLTLENGVKEIPFLFNNVNLRGTDRYHFLLGGSGYADSWPSSGLAWRKAWPDPVYATNVSTSYTSVGRAPYTLYLIGAEI